MSEQKFLKTACEHCGENIEFPAEGLGMAVPCPHCQKRTRLSLPGSSAAVESVPPPSAAPSAPSSVPPVPSRAPAPPPTVPAAPSSASVREDTEAPKSKVGLLVGVALVIVALAAAGYF